MSYLTAYERLCLRITCSQFYSILGDPRAWHTLVWKDCGKRGRDNQALKLAVKLSASTVQSISIVYPREQEIAKYMSRIHTCRQVRFLTLSGRLPSAVSLDTLFSQLPSLHFLSITVGGMKLQSIFSIVCAAAKNLQILQIVTADSPHDLFGIYYWQTCGYFPSNLQICHLLDLRFWSEHFASFLNQFSRSDHPAMLSLYPKCSSAAGNLVNKYPLLEIVFYPNIEVYSILCDLPLKSQFTFPSTL